MTDTVAVKPEKVAAKKKADRLPPGTLPPYIKLSDAFALVSDIYEQGGGRASFDLLSEIVGNTSSSSSFFKKINALKAYGLGTEQNKTVSLNELGLAVAAPDSPESAGTAKKEAMLKIDLFSKLYDRHKGKILPDDSFLKNIIERDFKIPRDFSDAWMDAFKDAIEAVGLASVRPDGKTQIRENASSDNSQAGRQRVSLNPASFSHDEERGDVVPSVAMPISASGHSTKIMLTGGRAAEFKIPDSLTERDAQRLKGALDGLKTIIDSMVESSTDNGSES